MTQQPHHPQYPQAGYQVPQHQQHQQFPQSPVAPDGRPLADPGKRLLARLLDGLITVAVFVVGGLLVVMLMYGLTEIFAESLPGPLLAVLLIFGLIFGIMYVYEVEIPLRFNGQTPGKRVLKIAIAPLEPGAPLRRGQLTSRMFITLLFSLLANCLIGYLDSLWCLWDKPYQQCLHDKGARTVVVRVFPAGPH